MDSPDGLACDAPLALKPSGPPASTGEKPRSAFFLFHEESSAQLKVKHPELSKRERFERSQKEWAAPPSRADAQRKAYLLAQQKIALEVWSKRLPFERATRLLFERLTRTAPRAITLSSFALGILPAVVSRTGFVSKKAGGVERLLDRRGKGTRRQYLVRWHGRGPQDDNWERVCDLVNQKMVHSFDASLPGKKKRSPARFEADPLPKRRRSANVSFDQFKDPPRLRDLAALPNACEAQRLCCKRAMPHAQPLRDKTREQLGWCSTCYKKRNQPERIMIAACDRLKNTSRGPLPEPAPLPLASTPAAGGLIIRQDWVAIGVTMRPMRGLPARVDAWPPRKVHASLLLLLQSCCTRQSGRVVRPMQRGRAPRA